MVQHRCQHYVIISYPFKTLKFLSLIKVNSDINIFDVDKTLSKSNDEDIWHICAELKLRIYIKLLLY